MSEKPKLIRVADYQKRYLDDIKEHPRETYIDVLDRLIASEKEIKLHTHADNGPKEISDNKAAMMGGLLRERRIKLLYIDHDEIFDLFIERNHLGAAFVIRRFDLPEQWQVKDISYDSSRQAFIFAILSPSFPPVPKGAIPGNIDFDEKVYTDYKIMEKKQK